MEAPCILLSIHFCDFFLKKMIEGKKLDKKNKTQNFVSALFENCEITVVIKCFVIFLCFEFLLIHSLLLSRYSNILSNVFLLQFLS
jgi:hypothetical protein